MYIKISKYLLIIIILLMCSNCTRRGDDRPYLIEYDSNMFSEKWIVNVNRPIVSSLHISGELLIIQTSEEIIALGTNSGEIVWSRPFKSDNKNQSPISNGDILIITEETGNLVALKNKTGETIWRDTFCTEVTPQFSCERENDIVITERYVISSRYLEDLVAYTIDTGVIKWQNYLESRCSGHLVALNQNLYCLCGDQLYVINLDTGSVEKSILLDDIYNDIYQFDGKIILINSRIDTSKTILDFYNPISLELNRSVEINGIGAEQICESGGTYYLAGRGLIKVNLATGLYQQILKGDRYSCPIQFDNSLLIRKWTSNYLILNSDTNEIKSYLGDDSFTYEKGNSVDPILFDRMIFAPVGINHVIALSIKTK